MEKKEYAVGEEFQFGPKKLKVEKDTAKTPCKGCIFCSPDISCAHIEDFVGHCLGHNRTDKTNVIFVEVK